MTKKNLPWASGPGEILKHGIGLLKKDSDSNRRLAMINIDNAVELMMKTYLGLPKRITGLSITKKKYNEFSDSFPKLLDAIEEYSVNKLNGINLGEIEWFHRLRNELYHQGNGLTVERDKVEVYAELANILFFNLFGYQLIDTKEEGIDLLGSFMHGWIEFEKVVTNISFVLDEKKTNAGDAIRKLYKAQIISSPELTEIESIRQLRNKIAHGNVDYSAILKQKHIKRIQEIAEQIDKRFINQIKIEESKKKKT